MLRVIALSLALTAAPVSLLAQERGVTGLYDVEGSNPDGKGVYRGKARVERTGETFRVVWNIGNAQHVGTGVLRNGQFSTVYAAQGQAPGVAVYEVGPDGTLTGVWTGLNGQRLGTEIWRPSNRT